MAGFRAPLDLTNIMALHERVLPSREEQEALRQDQTPDDQLRYERPVRLGWGPARWSTSMALVPMDRVCHDVNGYYRELGVDWRATKKELKEAYVERDGPNDARLTYVFKQLLDPLTPRRTTRRPRVNCSWTTTPRTTSSGGPTRRPPAGALTWARPCPVTTSWTTGVTGSWTRTRMGLTASSPW